MHAEWWTSGGYRTSGFFPDMTREEITASIIASGGKVIRIY